MVNLGMDLLLIPLHRTLGPVNNKLSCDKTLRAFSKSVAWFLDVLLPEELDNSAKYCAFRDEAPSVIEDRNRGLRGDGLQPGLGDRTCAPRSIGDLGGVARI